MTTTHSLLWPAASQPSTFCSNWLSAWRVSLDARKTSMNNEIYDEGEHNKEVYAHFGLAFYLAGCFEHGLAIALMHAGFLRKVKEDIDRNGKRSFNRKKYEADFDAYMADQYAQTMGNLLKRVPISHRSTLTSKLR
jgi:hypothetical protein